MRSRDSSDTLRQRMLSVSLRAAELTTHTHIHRDKHLQAHICPDVVMWLAVTLSLNGCIYEMFRKGLCCRKLCQISNTTPHHHRETGT